MSTSPEFILGGPSFRFCDSNSANNSPLKIGVDYMSSFFDCIKYKLYIFLYMCFLISPYVWLRVPAYLRTRGGQSNIANFFAKFFLCNLPLVNRIKTILIAKMFWGHFNNLLQVVMVSHCVVPDHHLFRHF